MEAVIVKKLGRPRTLRVCSLHPPTNQQLSDLENSRQRNLKLLKLHLASPPKIKKRKVKSSLPCSCPTSMEKVKDRAVYCGICGLEKRKILDKRVMHRDTDSEQLGRAPKNASVFRNNSGSTSKTQGSKPGDKTNAEPCVLQAISTILDNGRRFTKPCPECGAANVIEMFGNSVHCTGCGKALGEYVFRWLPDCTNPEIRKMADLRQIGKLDGPEDNPLFRRAREIFRGLALHKLSEEDADRVCGPFMRGVKKMTRQYDKELKALLAAQCVAMKIPIDLESWR